jgi:hypothetical protein
LARSWPLDAHFPAAARKSAAQSRSANAHGGARAAAPLSENPCARFADTAAQNELCGPSVVIDASFFTKRTRISGKLAVLDGPFRRGNHMNWIYWDTAWSLFFSLVWFMTITHYHEAPIADAHLRDEAFGG